MRICVLTHTFPRNKEDVAAAFMKDFCDGLVENGNKVTVVTPFDPDFKRHGDPFKIVNYKYIWPNNFYQLGYSRTMKGGFKLRKKAYLLLPFLLVAGIFALLKTVRREKIEVISVHWILPNGLIALVVSKITGVPYVVTLPGTDAYLAKRYKIFGIVAKIIALWAKGIISNSKWLLNRILELGVKNKPNIVISYPVNVSKYKSLKMGLDAYREKLSLTGGEIIVLAVGRLEYKKGFEYLIRAMPKILKENPDVYLIIGGDGDLREELKSTARKVGVEGRTIFVGTIPRDQITNYYNLADIMVAPSVVDKQGNVDGGPVVSFESMACGKPQVLTSILGAADIITDGVNGFIVSPENSDALANAIIKLAKSEALREKMGRANRTLVTTRLSTKYIGRQYTEFFRKVIS